MALATDLVSQIFPVDRAILQSRQREGTKSWDSILNVIRVL